jgi:hypothetical protein
MGQGKKLNILDAMPLKGKDPRPYSQHFIFFVAYEWAL